ncbi:hypothetical protein BDV25DRAFT_140396 [Aspergillus avenaceus]|uniref:Carrier domain-containing protein n=1 Tax=Aspergillus avenaceus TaxID=36643 RepID=A0A5N6TU44_ASPAV|nr:hypothetical protein BDV25DRAFT_140396 [Aspergillus avenaceus]
MQLPEFSAVGSAPINGNGVSISDEQTAAEPLERLAIIGMSCRLPGNVSTLEEFWDLCSRGRSAWSDIPKSRFNASAFYHPNPDRPGSLNPQGGHFLQEDVGLFDAPFFQLTRQEACSLDPQQRLMLECVYEALENAGLANHSLTREKVGVFTGASFPDYELNNMKDIEAVPMYAATGSAMSLQANRISYFFDFQGPSITVDTACSSSLSAVHMACQSLRAGECSTAIVAGTHLNLTPESFVSMSRSRLLADTGRSYAFDHRGTGFGRGEGAGCIILRTLEDAEKAEDAIRALIINTGVNQDGRTRGITMPSGAAQEALIRSVYHAANLDPANVGYVEAHGTGTKVGDPIEATSLHATFGKGRTPRQPLLIGSVKSNIGHTEGASGVISIIKTALMLERGFVVPNCNFDKANEEIPLEKWNMKVPKKLLPWPRGKPYASVNNFGFGGSNAHCILEAAPKTRGDGTWNVDGPRRRLYVLSGHDRRTTVQRAKDLEAYLVRHPAVFDCNLLGNLAYTLGQRRTFHPWRLAVTASSDKELEQFFSDIPEPSRALRDPNVAFVFTGQGAQWHGMGKELLGSYRVFKQTMNAVDRCLAQLGANFSVSEDILTTDVGSSSLSAAYKSQPACTAIQLALTDLLASWGITPTAVTGHSSGEIAAAYAARILTLEECVRVAYARGLAAKTLSESLKTKGAMLAVGASVEDIRPSVEALQNGHAVIACVNSGSSVTVSGDESAIIELQSILDKRGLFTRKLKVDVAYHSHHMQQVSQQYLTLIGDLAPKPSDIPFHSAVHGRVVLASELGASYWVENLVSRVEFVKALENLTTTSTHVTTLVELGPHCALQMPVKDIVRGQDLGRTVNYLPSLKRNENAAEAMHKLAVSLFLQGFMLNLEAINLPDKPLTNRRPTLLTNLPKYPWNHTERYWHSSRLTNNLYHRKFPRSDILGSLCTENIDFEPRWRNIVRADDHSWIRQHKVHGNNVYPMAGFLIMATEALIQNSTLHGVPTRGITLRDVAITRMLAIPDSLAVETMLTLRPCRNESPGQSIDSWYEFKIFSWVEGRGWDQHCNGFIKGEQDKEVNPVDGHQRQEALAAQMSQQIASIRTACTIEVDKNLLYDNIRSSGVEYGPMFRALSEIAISDEQDAMAIVQIPETKASMPHQYETECTLHPATLDNCTQIEWVLRGYARSASNLTYMPSKIKSVFISVAGPMQSGTALHVYAHQPPALSTSQPQTTCILVTEPNDPSHRLIEMDGIVLVPVSNETGQADTGLSQALAFKMHWEPCLDFLSEDSFKSMLPGGGDRHGAQRSRLLKRVSEEYLRNALSCMSAEDVAKLVGHRLKFYQWVQQIVHATESKGSVSAQAIERARTVSAAGELICKIGDLLPGILRGDVDPLAPMLEDDLLSRYYQDIDGLREGYAQASVCIGQMAHQRPQMNILEIGAGTGGATLPILQSLGGGTTGLPARFSHYTYTDISPGFFEKAKVKFEPWSEQMTYRTLDITSDPVNQAYQPHSYDLVVACNVLHATPEILQTIANVRSLLKPGGKLLLIEETTRQARHFPFAALPGWWLSLDNVRADGPLLDLSGWDSVMKANDFSGIDLQVQDFSDPVISCGCLMVSTASSVSMLDGSTEVVVIKDDSDKESYSAGLIAKGIEGLTGFPPSIQTLAHASVVGKLCVFLAGTNKPVLSEMDRHMFQNIQRLVTNAKGLMWVSHHSKDDPQSLGGNMAIGLARTIRSETGLPFATLDLGEKRSMADIAAVRHIRNVFNGIFGRKSQLTQTDLEFAVRQGRICVPRLVDNDVVNSSIMSEKPNALPQLQYLQQSDRPLRLTAANSRMLDELYFTDDNAFHLPLPKDAIEIQVHCVGLNFRDVLMAMGQLHGDRLGQECSGIVSRVGEAVTEFQVGDRVCAMVPGSLSTHVRCPTACASAIPPTMSLEVAASIPAVYCTVIYSLIDLARLCQGESVLIHAAAGGVGQAAIVVAQAIGAKMFVTVGSEDKKRFLMEAYHLQEDQIFYSRDLSFVQGIQQATDGQGVDVALNSLSGDALQATFGCVAPFGRFVELGKRDIVQNSRLEMVSFDKNISFSSVDLGLVREKRPHLLRRLMRDSLDMFTCRQAQVQWPITTLPVSELESGFRALQGGQVIGKIVVRMMGSDENAMVKVHPVRKSRNLLNPDASYVVVGGTGGIGLDLASWFSQNGARNIILISRSGVKSASALQTIQEMTDNGVRVHVCRCDISNLEAVEAQLEPILQGVPPVRGVIYGAMVLRDMLFEKMTYDDYATVMKPRVHGIWNLERILEKTSSQLDFFVNLSSAASFVGNRGQAPYAASGGFMAALAQYPDTARLPYTTIELPVVRGVGYLSDGNRREEITRQLGTDSVDADDIRSLVAAAIRNEIRDSSEGHCVVGFNSVKSTPIEELPFWANDPKLSVLACHSRITNAESTNATQAHGEVPPSIAIKQLKSKQDVETMIATAALQKISSILMRPLDEMDPAAPMSVYGLDSLVTIEVRNWITRELEANLQILEILASESAAALAQTIMKKSALLSPETKAEWGLD